MNKILINNDKLILILLILFSFFTNFYYGNIGVFPIDTFAFFDTGYNILLDRHPFKDIWVTTGPVVDYFQAIFFKITGFNWRSYIIHGSVLNVIISVSLFVTLKKLSFNKYLCLFYSSAFALLCYPVSGTPFAYIHSYVFSLLSILIFFNVVKFESKVSLFFLPWLMVLSFFSMQNPATYTNIIILVFLLFYFLSKRKIEPIKFFLIGCISVVISLSLFLIFYKIPIQNIIEQYFLFPLTMAENRIYSSENSPLLLSERFTVRGVLGHFKFLNLYIALFIIFTILKAFEKKLTKENFIINTTLILLGVSLIFNQLITANQTYIFSFIIFLGAFFHLHLNNLYPKLEKKFLYLLILVLFVTVKYHMEYNSKRKFMDLQNVDLTRAVNAAQLDIKLKNLKWITPNFKNNPNVEIRLLKETIESLKKEKEKKMVMTHYQFFSLLLEENLYIPNRWYTHRNDSSYPIEGNKYFKHYQKHFSENIFKNKIKVIYIIGEPIMFENYLVYLPKICFDESRLNEITLIYKINNCN
tara:strand:- start:8447 stop:10027 length:1581 start_codon:yes stop_codon:yes gene_type:complete